MPYGYGKAERDYQQAKAEGRVIGTPEYGKPPGGGDPKMTYTKPPESSKLVAEPIKPKIEKAVKKKIEPFKKIAEQKQKDYFFNKKMWENLKKYKTLKKPRYDYDYGEGDETPFTSKNLLDSLATLSLNYPDMKIKDEFGMINKENAKQVIDQAYFDGSISLGDSINITRTLDTMGEGITGINLDTKYLDISGLPEENKYTIGSQFNIGDLGFGFTGNIQDDYFTKKGATFDYDDKTLTGGITKDYENDYTLSELGLDKTFDLNDVLSANVKGGISNLRYDGENYIDSSLTPGLNVQLPVGSGILKSNIAKNIMEGGDTNLGLGFSYPFAGGEFKADVSGVLSENPNALLSYDYTKGDPYSTDPYLGVNAEINPFTGEWTTYAGLKKKFNKGGRVSMYQGGNANQQEDPDQPGANFNQLLELSIKLENARTFASKPKPNGATTITSDDWLETIDPGGWATEDEEDMNSGGRVGYDEGTKPQDYAGTLKLLLSKEAQNTLDPRTWTDLTYDFAKKARDAGQISDKTYQSLMMPLFGETGEKITEAIERHDEFDGGRVGFDEAGLVNKRGQYHAQKSAAKFKAIVDEIFTTKNWGGFKPIVTESQKRHLPTRTDTGAKVPAQYIKKFTDAIKAGPGSQLFEELKVKLGRTTEDLLLLEKNRPGKKGTIKIRSKAAIESWSPERKLTDEEKKLKEKQKYLKRKEKENIGIKYASEADLKDFNAINNKKEYLNKYFNDNPKAINETEFGKKIKNQMDIRINDKGEIYFNKRPNKYYIEKAMSKNGIFSIFDINAIKTGERFTRVPDNLNLSTKQFNEAFIEGQVNKFFKKGGKLEGNTKALNKVIKILKENNIRVKIDDVGRIGEHEKVAATGKENRIYPRVTKSLQILGLPETLTNFSENVSVSNRTKPQIFARKILDTGQKAWSKLPFKNFRILPSGAIAATDFTLMSLMGVPPATAALGASGWLTKKPEIARAIGAQTQTMSFMDEMNQKKAEENLAAAERLKIAQSTAQNIKPFELKENKPTYGPYADQIKNIKI